MESEKHLLDVAYAHVKALHQDMIQARELWFNTDPANPSDQDRYQQYREACIAYDSADRLYRELLMAQDERLAAARAKRGQ